MIYQFLQDETGIVLAESIKGNLPSALGYRHPEFDIPKQARKLFTTNLDRQTPDIFEETIQIIGLKPSEINLSKSKIRAMSPNHLQYLKNTNLTASASFSIIIDNKLWGLVCCQHQAKKYITIQQRKLCNYIIDPISKHFENKKAISKLTNEIQLKDFENELKGSIISSKSTQYTLGKYGNNFLKVLSASGLIISFGADIIRIGETPKDDDFYQIKEDIDSLYDSNTIFTTHEYSNIKNNFFIDTENISGIARINFDKYGLNSIYFFRPQSIKDEIWAGEPKKFIEFSIECNALAYSPRASFEAWKKQIIGESEKWTEDEKFFLHRLYLLIKNCVII